MASESFEPGREMSRRELFRMVVPKGDILTGTTVVLDVDRCSACTLCARDCPTGAITAAGDASVRLSFHSTLCDGCGVCVEVCPEKCLQLKQDKAGTHTDVVLFQDEFARCEKCGSVIGSKAMIKRVRSKLRTDDASLAAKIQLCPVCKGKSL